MTRIATALVLAVLSLEAQAADPDAHRATSPVPLVLATDAELEASTGDMPTFRWCGHADRLCPPPDQECVNIAPDAPVKYYSGPERECVDIDPNPKLTGDCEPTLDFCYMVFLHMHRLNCEGDGQYFQMQLEVPYCHQD